MRDRVQIRYTVDGQRHEETLDLPATRSGLTEAARIRRTRIEARKFSTTDTPFEAIAQQYLDAADLAYSSRNTYRDLLNIYWSPLRGRGIATITPQELLAIDDGTEWPSERTRQQAFIPLRQVLRYALARGIIHSKPWETLQARKRRKTPEPDPYTVEERDTLLAWLDGTRAGPFYRVAFGTGARTGELLALRWEDFDGESLFIRRARTRGRLKDTKTSKSRRVLLLPEIADVLNRLPRPIKGGWIFTTSHGEPYQKAFRLNEAFHRAHRETGVRRRTGPYPWRHTYASLALSSGVRPSLIAAQLGHRLDLLLTTYGRYIPRDDDRTELAKMGAPWVQGALEGR